MIASKWTARLLLSGMQLCLSDFTPCQKRIQSCTKVSLMQSPGMGSSQRLWDYLNTINSVIRNCQSSICFRLACLWSDTGRCRKSTSFGSFNSTLSSTCRSSSGVHKFHGTGPGAQISGLRAEVTLLKVRPRQKTLP